MEKGRLLTRSLYLNFLLYLDLLSLINENFYPLISGRGITRIVCTGIEERRSALLEVDLTLA